MTFSRRFLVTAAVAASCVSSGFSTASACGHRCSRGFSRYTYARPVYRQVQPLIRHVQPVVPVQPVTPIQNGQPIQQIQPQQGLQPMAPGQQTPAVGRPVGGQPSQGIPAPAPQQPLRTVGPAPAGTKQGLTAPAQDPAAGDARMSALQALGGFAPPAASSEPTRPAAPQTPAHVGRWSAAAGNKAAINLTLNADGTFLWRAVNGSGSASDFSGRYQITQGRLTLTRATDGQNLSGSMQQTDSGTFRFQVAGTNAAALTFSRN